jgi:hypothetical protein
MIWTTQARQVPGWLSYGRFARFDTGAWDIAGGLVLGRVS